MLPFLVGAIVGAGAIVAVNNNKKIKEKVISGASSVKSSVEKGATTVKETAIKAKEKVKEKVDCFTSKEGKVVVKKIEESQDDK